jgi:hypothetical protein
MATTCFDKCTNASYLISNCILQLLCDSKIVYELNLSDLIIVDGVNSSLDIYSGTTFITNLSSDELALLGLTRAILEAERTACNCCLASAEETDLFAPSAYTPLCDSANPNLYYLAYFILVNGVKENHYITMPSGVDTIGDLPATAIPCKEPKIITACYNANGVLYTNIICLSGSTVIGTLWLNMTDNSVSTTMPVGAVPCKEIKVIAVEKYCATKSNGTAYYLAYKGSYADYINAGGNPNAIDLGTFQAPYDGWLYAGLCATSLPNSVDDWEWTDIASPIYATNSGNTYGPLTLIPNGNTLTCGVEQKNIEKIKYSDDTIRWVEDNSDHSILVDFDITDWELLDGACPVLRDINFIDCRTIQTAQVESVGAVYVLNNKFESVETVYDIQQSTIVGSIIPTISGNRLTIPFSGLTVTNIAPVTGVLAVDFGSGYLNFGTTPDQDFTNQPNGEYEAKIYYLAFVDGKVIYLLLGVCEFSVTNGVPTITSTVPINVNRSIDRCIGIAKQQFCEGTPVGDPYDPNGNSYVFQGNKSYKCPELINEFIPNGNSDDITQILGLETPNGVSYTNNIVPQNPQPAIVKSITVTKQSGAIVEVSFDNGLTWNFRIIVNGSFTWGQGNSEGLNTAFMKVRQLGNGTFNIHWEI